MEVFYDSRGKKRALVERFQRITARAVTGNPNDFGTQLPLTLVSFAPEEQSMLCCFPVERRFGNLYGIAHGGIIATMLDIAQGAAIASYAESDCRIAAVSLQLSYLKPVRIGARPYVRTKINELGETMAFCAAEAWQEEGVITTSAAAVYHLLSCMFVDISDLSALLSKRKTNQLVRLPFFV